MLAASMVSSARDAGRSAPSIVNEPAKAPKDPRTLATMAWRTLKPMFVWAGSMTQVPEALARVRSEVAVMVLLSRGRA